MMPNELAAAIDAMAENPKGGKMAAIAYKRCAQLIRNKLGTSGEVVRLSSMLDQMSADRCDQDRTIGNVCECPNCGRMHRAIAKLPWALSHGDVCRLSQAFNERANLQISQDYRINEWLKHVLRVTRSAETDSNPHHSDASPGAAIVRSPPSGTAAPVSNSEEDCHG